MRCAKLLVPLVLVALLGVMGGSAVFAQSSVQLPAPTNVTVSQGDIAGQVTLSWDPLDGANFYRVGWVSFPDYQAATDAGREWEDAFVFVDVANLGQTSYEVVRLEPGVLHAFVVGSVATRFGIAEFSEWNTETLQAGSPAATGAVQPPIAGGVGAIPVTGSATAGNCTVGMRLHPGQGCNWPHPTQSGSFKAVIGVVNGGSFHGLIATHWDNGSIWISSRDRDSISYTTGSTNAPNRHRISMERESGNVWRMTKVNEPYVQMICPTPSTNNQAHRDGAGYDEY